MKKINNKGFTLIELLATISILAIIMLMAIPNVVGIVQRNKNKTYIEDARKMIALAKYEYAKDKSKNNWTLEKLDPSKEIVDGPNNKEYNRENSCVTLLNGTYRVTLLEEASGSEFIGINNKSENQINSDDVMNIVSQNITISTSTPSTPY